MSDTRDLAKSVEKWVNRVIDDLPSGEEVCDARACGYVQHAGAAAMSGALVALREAGSHLARSRCERRFYGVGEAARDISEAADVMERLLKVWRSSK
jgi:hypothetical protein